MKPKQLFKNLVTGLPLIAIIGASFFPLKGWAQQALILFILIWFYTFSLFEVFGR